VHPPDVASFEDAAASTSASARSTRASASASRRITRRRPSGRALNFFHIENWYSVHAMNAPHFAPLRLYGRGQRNAGRVELRRNAICSARLPAAFEGFTILHLSDLHVEMSRLAMARGRRACRRHRLRHLRHDRRLSRRHLGPYAGRWRRQARRRAPSPGGSFDMEIAENGGS